MKLLLFELEALEKGLPSVYFFIFYFYFLILFIYLFIYFWLCWVFGSCEGFL